MARVTVDIRETIKKGYTYSQVRFTLQENVSQYLGMLEEENVYFSFFKKNPKSFFLSKARLEKKIFISEKRKLKEKGIKNKGKYILFPSSFYKVLEELDILRHFTVKEFFDNEKRRVEFIMPTKEDKKNNVILFKVNKGGIGKTFLSCQIGHGLALLGKKVLIITSDSQNNVLNFLHQGEKSFEKGLHYCVTRGGKEVISLRKNLDFIPLESNRLGSQFVLRLQEWLDERRKEYDYILIDSVPTMKIDSEFVRLADHIIIPCFCDEATIEGVLNLIDEVDIQKVLSIQVNRFKPRKIETKYLEFLKGQLEGNSIYFGEPIKDLSFISSMLDKKKSIWEYKNKQTEEVQDILFLLLDKIIKKVTVE